MSFNHGRQDSSVVRYYHNRAGNHSNLNVHYHSSTLTKKPGKKTLKKKINHETKHDTVMPVEDVNPLFQLCLNLEVDRQAAGQLLHPSSQETSRGVQRRSSRDNLT